MISSQKNSCLSWGRAWSTYRFNATTVWKKSKHPTSAGQVQAAYPIKSYLPQYIGCQDALQGLDVDIALELFLQGFVHAFDPELHLAVAIEGAGGLDTELVDGAVGDGVVVALAAGDALHIEHDEALGGEHPLVAEDAEGSDDLFVGDEDGAKLALQFVDIDLGGVAKKMIQ